jgi:hypothetical protein
MPKKRSVVSSYNGARGIILAAGALFALVTTHILVTRAA